MEEVVINFVLFFIEKLKDGHLEEVDMVEQEED